MTAERVKNGMGDLYEPEPNSGCWLWLKGSARYGELWINGQHKKAHRVAYMLFVGAIPDGLCVCHHCDNPVCINPKHLFLGTHADNSHDRDAKGRRVNPCGEAHGKSKLTEENIRDIRRRILAGDTHLEIGQDLGVHKGTVTNIHLGNTWGWLQ